jgi:alpha-glucuronidase
MLNRILPIIIFASCLSCSKKNNPEDGSELWLRYKNIETTIQKMDFQKKIQHIVIYNSSEVKNSIQGELKPFIGIIHDTLSKTDAENTLFIGPATSIPFIDSIDIKNELLQINDDGFVIKSTIVKGKKCIVITSNSEIGSLYGTFRFIQLIQMGHGIDSLYIVSRPKIQHRILDHWDNLDGSIERGYAGTSLWFGINKVSNERIKNYARANASIGINGIVINNVNATPKVLTTENLSTAVELADIFRPYGIRIYLAVNFSSPHEMGGLPTSDPLDPRVAQWWKDKAKEIYQRIPDFGGFLVKANSEGLPGPQDFGRTHADGANILAAALAPYHGIVMWRAFVYKSSSEDRALQGYNEFKKLDGKFAENVLIQVKNGAIDFQPREPFHQLFGALQKTNMSLELQITQEYLGQSEQAVFMAPLYKEVFDSETYAKGEGSKVGKVIDGTLFDNKITSIAGVANIGNSITWCGSNLAQANWYAFGRLAWDYNLSSEQIAEEWIKLTFSSDTKVVSTMKRIMLPSREACVNYMTPLGLNHIMGYNHHRGPQPWLDTAGRFDWNSIYYHRADSIGLGFDRTTNGSDVVSQYFPPLNSIFNNIDSCPEKYLLWFHHVKWNYKMKSGRTLWDELCIKYNEGVDTVKSMQKLWKSLDGMIDAQRYSEVSLQLDKQLKEAIWWKDACLLYFQTFSKMPFPDGFEKPKLTLKDYQDKKYQPF